MAKPQEALPIVPDYRNCPHIGDNLLCMFDGFIRACRLGDGKHLNENEIEELLEEAQYRSTPPQWWEYLPKEFRKRMMKTYTAMKKAGRVYS